MGNDITGSIAGEIVVIGRFDGGNPQHSSDIVKVDDLTFKIFPYSEDRDDNYMFRVDLKVCSSYREPKTVNLRFEWRAWQAERYMDLRRSFFCRYEGGDWRIERGEFDRNVSTLSLTIPPGETEVSMNASYNYETLQRYMMSLRRNPIADLSIIGFSEENRNIWCLTITDRKILDQSKRKILIISRVHSYETTSSYCAESMINYLLSKDRNAKDLLSKFVFYIVPMPNPDGVYNGLCKLTKENGLDFSHGNILKSNDRAGKALIALARSVRPHYVLDIHSLMDREHDQIGSSDEKLLESFMKIMPDQSDVGRSWKVLLRKYNAPPEPPSKRLEYGLTSFCIEEIGSTIFLSEFSWFGMSIKKMEETAVKSLEALTSAILGNENYEFITH
ncbi:MAG: M14 family zinc carboxypeptidase [Thermoproteota archaeon]